MFIIISVLSVSLIAIPVCFRLASLLYLYMLVLVHLTPEVTCLGSSSYILLPFTTITITIKEEGGRVSELACWLMAGCAGSCSLALEYSILY